MRLGSFNLLTSRWVLLGAGALALAGCGGWWLGRISPKAAAPLSCKRQRFQVIGGLMFVFEGSNANVRSLLRDGVGKSVADDLGKSCFCFPMGMVAWVLS